ncbi:probably inactive leucine-rich repeat receptor-like protein kinase At2g25790 [Olea europaea var. sylvestris]|uniref:probably inactive leucine-rich repeat receptor-like protein kinase At2g25790 n=1 Tax=Olea europaea var. sylvestris TaxID=158386 RepID=UPI000C1D18EF|nr:probably inactive leucine-rich repeat receptor-like protein kinase At2g25790 [Olea europaea var. sylvestris]
MEKKGPKRYRFFVMLVFIFMFWNLYACKGFEFELLLSIKASINDPLESLSTWNSSLSFCKWYGVTCYDSSHVAKIELSGKNLSGKLSEKIFMFPYVQNIDLSSNQFVGEIPGNLSCFSLRNLNLSNNNLTGPIPGGFLPLLETLDLSNNMLSGKIPEEIGLFSGLKVLDFGGNVLTGKIPKSITNMTRLEVLTLASNQFIGEIPGELGFMKSLRWIYLGYNNFSGGIPKEIGELTSLNHLDLVYNNLTGEIPSSLGNLTNLQSLYLYFNKFTGGIPRSIFSLRKLVSLDLSVNFLSSEIPELVIQLQNLEILHLFSNNFTGKIPNALTSLPHLQILQLWSNKFSGEIPKDLGKYNNLTVLDLSSNNLTGKIPENLCSSGHLFKLILFSNSLESKIPESLSSCRTLQRVRLQNNRLSGELSPGFTSLPLVYFLDISRNNLFGSIDERKWDMPELQMLSLARNRFSGNLPDSFGSKKMENLDLSGNNFSGSIPQSLGKLSELMELKLSENKLSGKIPDELSFCKMLVNLDLSRNQLTGGIPISLSEMPVLSQLDLSVNQLSGEIPSNLGKVESLVQVNISHNNFHGRLPSTGAFLAISSSAVAGNSLCGGETSGLPPCSSIKNRVTWSLMACLLVSFVVVVLAISFAVFIRRRNKVKLKTIESEDGTWEFQFLNSKVSKSITIKDIVSSIKEENLISRGKKVVLSYKGKSTTNNMQFLAEEITSFSTKSSTGIIKLCNLKHANIVKLLGICRSEKVGILVYEYIEGKDLHEALPGLSWERRHNVAIGIAKALRYLHCYCSTGILAGDLSPRKIFVDENDEARLRLSLPGLVSADDKCFISSAYLAPETRASKGMTEKSDIYGYGLVLIQLLTGKSPADDSGFGIHQSIVEWARYCYSDCHLDMWVDPTIKNHAVMNNQNQIVEIMNLALQCTATDPAARPCAIHIVKTLESAVKSSSCGFELTSTNV